MKNIFKSIIYYDLGDARCDIHLLINNLISIRKAELKVTFWFLKIYFYYKSITQN